LFTSKKNFELSALMDVIAQGRNRTTAEDLAW